MKYSGSVFAVKDINAARAFYEEIFGLKLFSDYGRNIVFEGGLSLQQDFDWLTGVPKNEIITKANNCEMFFETDDFDAFVQKLKGRQDVLFLHDVMEYSWGQHVIRFYDPDGHLIEVGEDMKFVVERFLSQGKSMDEIAEIMEVTVDEVEKMLDIDKSL